MGKVVSYTNLLGEVITVPVRGKHYVQPKGYAGKPGLGPKGETCKTCQHLCYNQFAKAYPKCELARYKWTGGRGSDILVKSPACELWEKAT